LKDGKADIATLWLSTGIQARAQGIRLVNIAQMVQKSALMLVAKKSRGVTSPQDLEGRKVGLWGPIFQIQPRAFFRKYHLNVTVVPQSFSVNLFLRDGVQITNANWFDEYHSIINAGYNADELNIFFFADYGLNLLEDGIYCLAEKKRQDPQLCADFVNATQEGWLAAYADPEKAIDIVVAYAKKMNLPVNRIHQRWMLDRYRDLYTPKGEMSIVLAEKDYLLAAEVLKDSGQISAIPPFKSFFDPVELKSKKDD